MLWSYVQLDDDAGRAVQEDHSIAVALRARATRRAYSI